MRNQIKINRTAAMVGLHAPINYGDFYAFPSAHGGNVVVTNFGSEISIAPSFHKNAHALPDALKLAKALRKTLGGKLYAHKHVRGGFRLVLPHAPSWIVSSADKHMRNVG